MTGVTAKGNIFGIASCIAFIVSAMIFYHVQKNVLFMYPGWDLAFGSASFVGVVLAITGIVKALLTKRFPIFSVIGIVLNIAPIGFMFLVFAMGSMH
jgi:hypothetical protein